MASKKLNFWAILVSTIFILFANLQVTGAEEPGSFIFRVGAQGGGNLDLTSETITAGIPLFGFIDASAEYMLDNDVAENVTTSIGLNIGVLFQTKSKYEQKWTYTDDEGALTTSIITLEPSIIKVPVEIFLKQGLGKGSSIKIVFGKDFYPLNTNYSYQEIKSGVITDVVPDDQMEKKGTGWHVSLRPEIFFSKHLSLVFDISLFSLDLGEFSSDENVNQGTMQRFMGKDNNGFVYGPPLKVKHRVGGSISGYRARVGLRISIGTRKAGTKARDTSPKRQ